ncbi:MAG TPA: hypothetical protein VMM14_05690 [Acidimicrobiia bacterium]|nr:hypothetical protein [Acidimicrobiia bacterium]
MIGRYAVGGPDVFCDEVPVFTRDNLSLAAPDRLQIDGDLLDASRSLQGGGIEKAINRESALEARANLG